MGRALKAAARTASALNRLLEIVLMFAVAVLVLDVLWGVVSRYLLGAQSSWTEELARMVLIWVVMLGAAVAMGSREHLGLDFIVTHMDAPTQKLMRITVDLIVLAFTVSVMLVGGISLVADTLRLGQMMMAVAVPKGYVYLAVPVSGFFFLVFCIQSLLETLFGGKAPTGQEEAGP